jgi:probable HAF family extracellular repeat protein
MRGITYVRLTALVCACVASIVGTTGWSQRLTWLNTMEGGWSQAEAVSADGRVVVGWTKDAKMRTVGFRWENGKMHNLGMLPGGDWCLPIAVSTDGRVVVGNATNAHGKTRAFRWENGKMHELGVLPGRDESEATAVSADGRVVVGYSTNARGQKRAFRWQAGVMLALGESDRNKSEAVAVSADGSVVVGNFNTAWGKWHAFRWTQTGGFQGLGALSRGGESKATAVSADGRVVVGWTKSARGPRRAFRWENGKMQDLGVPPGYDETEAVAVSADGRVVVGYARTTTKPIEDRTRVFRWENGRMQVLELYEVTALSPDGSVVFGRRFDDNAACRWTAARGVENLNTVYANLLAKGSTLWFVSAVTPDGRYLVGVGNGYSTHPKAKEAFLLDTRAPQRQPQAQKKPQQPRTQRQR